MNSIRLFLLDFLRNTTQRNLYNQFIFNYKHYSTEDILKYSEKESRRLVEFHIANNPCYKNWIISQGINISDWQFNQLPIITKKDMTPDMAVKSEIFKWSHSGGTTGMPFSYPLSEKAVSALWPNLWRAFSSCDIHPCEKILMIAGPSLFNNRNFKRKIFDAINRFIVVSAFDLNDQVLNDTVKKIKQAQIKAIYGYTSSVLVFLEFLQKNNIHITLKGIFTTSETFIPKVRLLAKEFCSCDVIDIYGANDGGICAFECKAHSGYHISFERTYLEIIDHKIIITDLYNTAYPFIRYQVGDMTSSEIVDISLCKCGSHLFRINNISGRINSYITDLDGTKIHTEFFSHVFHKDLRIEQYQITEYPQKIEINIISSLLNLETIGYVYNGIIQKRFLKQVEFVINRPLVRLLNQKTPILVKKYSD